MIEKYSEFSKKYRIGRTYKTGQIYEKNGIYREILELSGNHCMGRIPFTKIKDTEPRFAEVKFRTHRSSQSFRTSIKNWLRWAKDAKLVK